MVPPLPIAISYRNSGRQRTSEHHNVHRRSRANSVLGARCSGCVIAHRARIPWREHEGTHSSCKDKSVLVRHKQQRARRTCVLAFGARQHIVHPANERSLVIIYRLAKSIDARVRGPRRYDAAEDRTHTRPERDCTHPHYMRD
jgi:hypothetical protein